MNGFRRKILSQFQSDLSSLIIGACRANGCLPPSHYVSRVYSTRLECSQSTGTPRTNRGPFFLCFWTLVWLYFVDLLIYCVNYHFRTVVFLPMAHAIRTPSHYWKWRNSWSLFCNNSRWDTNTKLHRWWKRGLAKMGVSLRYSKIWLSTKRTK